MVQIQDSCDSKDIEISNENVATDSGNTNGTEECTNIQTSKNTNELHDKDISQSNCTIDSKHGNETNDQIGENILKDDLESKNSENNKELNGDATTLQNENNEPNTWDDYDCYKISQENFFPAKVMDLDTQKIIITRFLNFYVGGKVPKGLRASDLLFAVISIIPLTAESDELIWHENEYSDDGSLFFMTPEEKLTKEFKAIVTRANKTCIDTTKNNNSSIIESNLKTNKSSDNQNEDNPGAPACDNGQTSSCQEQNMSTNDINSDDTKQTPSDVDKDDGDALQSFITDVTDNMSIKWVGSTRSASTSEPSSMQYGPLENSAFISSCNKILIEWDESQESRVLIKCFFGIVALILMRGIVKGKKNIINTFKSKNFLHKIRFIDPVIKYTPPHESCVEKCCKEMMLRERHHKVMFAKIILNSIRIDILQKEHCILIYHGLYNIFKMCVVDHTAYYDMGIINLLKSIYGYVGAGPEFSIILRDLKSEEINECMMQVRNFRLKYMKKENCFTYHWARYFDSTQFEYLSCRKSYATAVMLAVFLEKMMRSSDVWRSGWVRAQEVDLDRYKQHAEQLYKQYKHLCREKCTLQQQFFVIK